MDYIIGDFMPNVAYAIIPKEVYDRFKFPQEDTDPGREPTEEGLAFEQELVDLLRKYGMYDNEMVIATCILPSSGPEEVPSDEMEQPVDEVKEEAVGDYTHEA